MTGAFPGSLTPLSAPTQDALHPHAVILSADEPADPQEILRAFERSLTGDLPNSVRDHQDPRGQTEGPESLALVVGTSGSTGSPKQTALSVRALRASARATESFFADYSSADSAKQRRVVSARALCGGGSGSRPVGARRNDAGSCRIDHRRG